MIYPRPATVLLSELLSHGEILALLTGAIIPSAALALAGWRWRQERVMFYFGAYMLGLLLVFWVQEALGPKVDGAGVSRWRSGLSNLIQLPYAWLYLRFVRGYFEVEAWAPRWRSWLVMLEVAYVLPLALVLLDLVVGTRWASGGILALNLVNLLGSYMLAVKAWQKQVEGAGWFLAAVFPLALAGLLLAVQWLVEPGGNGINGMFPFWLGVILHLFIFVVAMGCRERRRAPRFD